MRTKHVEYLLSIVVITLVLAGCGGGGSGTGGSPPEPPAKSYLIGGLASGITAGNQVVVSNNGGDNLAISKNGPFTFGSKLQASAGYQVAIVTQPPGQKCTVSSGAGTNVVGDINNVIVSCSTDSFTISGTVTGLNPRTSVNLINNDAATVTIHDDGPFTFSSPVLFKEGYRVSVASQPPQQICTVNDGVGVNVVANVSNIRVSCSSNHYTIGGTVSGLKPETSVTLLNIGVDPVTVTGNTTFTFTTPVVYDGGFYISVGTQPAGSMCYVVNDRKNWRIDELTANVTNVNVFCLPEYTTTQPPPPQATLSETVTYQVDPAHSGQLSFGRPLNFPSAPAWKVSAREPDAPLVAEGKVFMGGTYDMSGFDLVTGKLLWSFVLNPQVQASPKPAHLAYDRGMVFALNIAGVLRALHPTTGATIWETDLGFTRNASYEAYIFTSSPVVMNGIVYVAGGGVGGLVIAVDQYTGKIIWTGQINSGGEASPVVTNEGVYVTLACDHTYKFHPVTGAKIWETPTDCFGGAQFTGAFRNGFLYSRDWGPYNVTGRIIDFATGHNVGKFQIPAYPTPIPTIPMSAVGINYGVFIQETAEYHTINNWQHYGTVAQGVDLKNGKILWTFAGDNGIGLAPILIDDTVILASKTGKMYALDARTGSQLWTGNAGDSIFGSDEFDARQRMGIGAGNGYIVVSTDSGLTVWKVADMPMPSSALRFNLNKIRKK